MTQLIVRSPYDGHLIKELFLQSEEEASLALAKAHQTFLNRDFHLNPYERIAILERLVVLMEEQKDILASQAAQEGGKPLMDSRIEVARAIAGVKNAIAHCQVMHGREVPMGLTASSQHRLAFTRKEPLGVVLAISAFNHPLNLIVHQVIPAIAVGCPVLVKPASSTPLSCIHLVNLLHEAGLAKQACQVLLCENRVAEKLVSDSRVAYFSFIGSAKVGWYLRSKLAPGAGCSLEHGGAAPVIVEADVDIDAIIEPLSKGGFYHAGQVCVSVQRIFAHHKIAKTLAKKLAQSAKSLIVGDPLDEKTQVGPLISSYEVDRVDEWVKEAIFKGAKCLAGGRKMSANLYEPTVLLDPPQQVRVSSQEIFGPVICVYSYKNRQEAIAQANSLPFIFQAAVFTKDLDMALDTMRRLNATAVMVNDHTAFRVDWMPFGGRKQSGLGLGGIPYSMEELTHEKMFVFHSPVL